MMKVNFVLFRQFECIVPIKRVLFRKIYAADKIFWRLRLEINLHLNRKTKFRLDGQSS